MELDVLFRSLKISGLGGAHVTMELRRVRFIAHRNSQFSVYVPQNLRSALGVFVNVRFVGMGRPRV